MAMSTQEVEFQKEKDKILSGVIGWESYVQGGKLDPQHLEIVKRFDKKTDQQRRDLFEKEGLTFAAISFALLTSGREAEKFSLTIIDDILDKDETKADLFLSLSQYKPEWPMTTLLRFLHSPIDRYNTHKVCRILAVLLLKNPRPAEDDVAFIFRWLAGQLAKPQPEDTSIAITCLKKLLQRDEYRKIFAAAGGVQQLSNLIPKCDNRAPGGVQALYDIVYCVWLVSFNRDVASELVDTQLIARLVETLKGSTVEKIQRIALASLRSFADKGNNNEEMIDAELPKYLDQLKSKKLGDEDMVEDIDALRESLAKNIVLLSSFDAYKKEVLSGKLEWSPVHKSERFWRENINRFEENNFQVLKTLVNLVTSSPDPKILAVACYDLGEFARFHPQGKNVIQKANGKLSIMNLMSHPDTNVAREALLATQKMMVTNWQFLSRATSAQAQAKA